jgi:arsenate reductase-like glutaredoxin family protein
VHTNERDFFKDPFTRAELEALAQAAGGIRPLIAFGSQRFRDLGRTPESCSDSELFEIALAEPRVLRRPLALTEDGRVLAGAKAVSSA